jgi:serine/threonine-protein kinase
VHAVTPGTIFSSRYEILGPIGAGGMGEVYRALDKNLGRHVAIKILPETFAEDKERMARFEREARLLAVLNHPNIAAIHGLEESEGRRFLVLELAEGETLQARLNRGPLAIEETLEICRGLAEGLEAAHEKEIIHRDLKPGNIMITPEGKVKILDFGLAKAYGGETTGVDIGKSPTITAQMTEPGVILGTAAYMSPEQARGRAVDKRTDIWAFGCVLYECLTDSRAFHGETVSDTLAHILKGEPDWSKLPTETPTLINVLLRRCLEKDPRKRLHDIADARIELQEETGLLVDMASAPAPRRLRPVVFVAVCVTVLVVGVLIGPVVRRLVKPAASPTSVPLVRSSVRLEPGCWLSSGEMFEFFNPPRPTRTELAVSTDGRFLIYTAVKADPGPSDRSCLYLRRFDQLEAKPIAGTEGGLCPFLSPGGDWVGFWADGKLMKIPSEGGIPTALCDVLRPFGFSWGPDNQIVFVRDRDSGLMRISADGGKPETLTVPDRSKEEFAHRLPHFLPDGNRILFTIKRHPWDLQPRVAVLELASRKWRVLLEDGADARYVATGHLAFLRQGTLMVVPFDLDRLEVIGQPVPALANVFQTLNTTTSYDDTAAGQFDISASGSLIYATGGIAPNQENALVWVDYKGQFEPVVAFKAPFYSTRLSPDGRRIAYSLSGTETHIWIHDLARDTATRLMSEGMAQWALWTPDGERLVFDWLKTGVPNIYRQPVDGSSPMERLTESEHFQWPGSLSPDGETLAFVEQHAETSSDIYFLNIRDRRATPFLNSRFFEAYPEISPDGRWIAYVTDESGREEVYVQAFPGLRGKWQISHEGGNEPLWAPNGRQLFYRSAGLGNQVWVVDVEAESGFSAGKPRLLFDLPGYVSGGPIRIWDISQDGRRFLMAKLGESRSQPITEIILVQNWFEELKRLVPTGKK